MNTDISDKAMKALANAAANASARNARERLCRDGGDSREAMRRRVLALAAERELPLDDYKRMLHKNVSTATCMAFMEKHRISADWLLAGSLHGLVKMTIDERQARSETQATQLQEITRLFGMLDDGERHSVPQHIRQIAAMQPRISNG